MVRNFIMDLFCHNYSSSSFYLFIYLFIRRTVSRMYLTSSDFRWVIAFLNKTFNGNFLSLQINIRMAFSNVS